MPTKRVGRNDLCPCGSGRKYKQCCLRDSFSGDVRRSQPVPSDGEIVKRKPEPAKPITRVSVKYAIDDAFGRAEVGFCYPLGTMIIMADGKVLPVEWLKPGMRFRLEDGGFATVTKVDEPKVWEPPSQEKDKHGNSVRRVIGTVKYTGYFPRFDRGVAGEILQTTPGHLFWSVTRNSWQPAESFRIGEMLRNRQGMPVPVVSISQIRMEFCDLYNIEVEDYHTYFVGGGPHGGIWTHNGMEMGCRVPRAAVAEAIEDGTLSVVSSRAAIVNAASDSEHHLFTRARKAWFRSRYGLDVDQYVVDVDDLTHQALHAGKKPLSNRAGWWDRELITRIRDAEAFMGPGAKLSHQQLMDIADDMRSRFRLSHLPIHPYTKQ